MYNNSCLAFSSVEHNVPVCAQLRRMICMQNVIPRTVKRFLSSFLNKQVPTVCLHCVLHTSLWREHGDAYKNGDTFYTLHARPLIGSEFLGAELKFGHIQVN
jgi:hypothetical protein